MSYTYFSGRILKKINQHSPHITHGFFPPATPRLLSFWLGGGRSRLSTITIALLGGDGHLGAVHLYAGDMHRLVPVRAEVLQGENVGLGGGQKWFGCGNKLPVWDQDLPQV